MQAQTHERKRVDVHRPSAIEPDQYVLVACLTHRDAYGGDIGACEFLRAEHEILQRHMAQTGGHYSDHDHGGNCHVCGAACVDEAVFWHEATRTYVRTGFDCAAKLDMGDARKFRRFRDEARQAEHYRAGRAKAKQYLRDAGLERAHDLHALEVPYTSTRSDVGRAFLRALGVDINVFDREHAQELDDIAAVEGFDPGTEVRTLFEGLSEYGAWRMLDALNTVYDIVTKLVRYGSITDKQESLLARLVDDCDHGIRARDDERKAEQARAEPAPEGRAEIEGEVLSTRAQDGYAYASIEYKMLVRDDRGFKTWSTIPQSILFDLQERRDSSSGRRSHHDVHEDLKGQRVRFTATLQPKHDDPKFAIGKRPARAELLS